MPYRRAFFIAVTEKFSPIAVPEQNIKTIFTNDGK